MANASQLFKDDEGERLGNGYTPDDNQLRGITGINKGQEAASDRSAESGAASDIADREKNAVDAGSPKGSEDRSTGVSGLAAAESLGVGFSSLSPALGAMKGGKIISALWGSKRRKQTTIGGGIAGLIVAGVMFFLGIASGPFQLIHLSQILQKSFSHSENASSIRTSGLFRYAKTGNIGQTRVGFLGSKIFGSSIDQLNSLGVEFNTGGGSNIKGVTVETGKLAEKYPELNNKNMSDSAKTRFIAEKLGVPETDIKKISDGKFTVNTRNYGVKATRLLLKNSAALLDNGKIVFGIKFRVLAKFYDTPSLFHPMKKITAAVEKKLTDSVERRRIEKDRQASTEKQIRDKITVLKDTLNEKLGGGKAKIGGALFITGLTCTIKGSTDTIVKFNNAAILAPSIVKASSVIALGSQIQSGQDITASQVGAAVESMQAPDGKTIWQGEALQVMANNSRVGEEMPSDYKQLYSNSTFADSLNSTLNTPALNALCSPVGLVGQLFVGGALIVSSLPSGGSSDLFLLGLKAATSTVSSILIVNTVEKLVETNNIIPEVLSGPLGGNILAYGARAAAGVEARSSGGIELTSAQTAILDKQSQAEDQNSFNSKSLFAKVFDVRDYRSLSGKLADSVKPSLQQNVASILGGFTHLGSLITHAFSSLLPKVGAAPTPYDWGFPEYGIPPEVLANSAYENPYANADKSAWILDRPSGKTYIDKAAACFGATIKKVPTENGSQVWDVSYDNTVYSTDEAYTGAGCNNTSDPDWIRIMLFVFDTKTMKAAACYNGDTQSCQELGQVS